MIDIQALYDYFNELEILNGNLLNFDFLGNEPIEYTIEPIPTETKLRPYTDGGSLEQYIFLFGSKEYFNSDAITQIENSQWYINFAKMIEEKNNKKELPKIEGIQSIECLNSGTINEANVQDARYGIQMRITYYKGGI